MSKKLHLTVPVTKVLAENADLCKLLGDKTRLRLCFLMAKNGPTNVGDLCEAVDQGQPNVSHHLSLLRANGVVTPRREGKNIFYTVANDTVRKLVLAFGETPTPAPAKPRASRAKTAPVEGAAKSAKKRAS